MIGSGLTVVYVQDGLKTCFTKGVKRVFRKWGDAALGHAQSFTVWGFGGNERMRCVGGAGGGGMV